MCFADYLISGSQHPEIFSFKSRVSYVWFMVSFQGITSRYLFERNQPFRSLFYVQKLNGNSISHHF
uniref:Uncharacterized protein n=1 Tax=Rhizophora mucronata TaxID=61149 RepID=A0A2P2IZL8_RHIMU